MKKIFILLLSLLTLLGFTACFEKVDYSMADKYAKEELVDDIAVYAASVTDIGQLVIAIDVVSNATEHYYDMLAAQYLDLIIKKYPEVKSAAVVDVKDCHFQKGAVVGKKYGKAYNRDND